MKKTSVVKKNNTKKNSSPKKNIAASYNRYKIFEGKQYTGVKIGRGHKWYYDKGIWTDKKITPEKWLINFSVKKRRAGKAPEGSGAPVGTEYHWFILAHQIVKKLDANVYSTEMNGVKYKLAHKRSDKEKWNSSENAQRKHLIKILNEFIKELEEETIEEFIASEHDYKKDKEVPTKKIKRKKKVEEEELVEV